MAEHSSPELVVFGATFLLGFVVIPIWMAMGLADYFCHRASDIEHTAGTRESIMHLTQFALVGIPLTAGLFLEIHAGLLLLMMIVIALHHAVAFVDVRYANARRNVGPVEQMIHSFLEIMPITAFLLTSAIEFGQLQALFGFGDMRADFTFRLRQPALPLWYVASVLSAAALANLAPYLEEFGRCIRAQAKLARA